MKATILKPITSNGVVLQPGDIVDVSGWRNARSLVSMRYLMLMDGEFKGNLFVKAKATRKRGKKSATVKIVGDKKTRQRKLSIKKVEDVISLTPNVIPAVPAVPEVTLLSANGI